MNEQPDDNQETSAEREVREAAHEEWIRERRESRIDKDYDDADETTAWYNRVAYIECSRDKE